MLKHYFILACVAITLVYVYSRCEPLLRRLGDKNSLSSVIVYGVVFGLLAILLTFFRYDGGTGPVYSLSYTAIVVALVYRGSYVYFISLSIYFVWLYTTPFFTAQTPALYFIGIVTLGYIIYLIFRKISIFWLSILIISITRLTFFITLDQFTPYIESSVNLYILQMILTIVILGVVVLEIQHLRRMKELNRYYEKRTYLDDLTGAENRRSLRRSLEQAEGELSLAIIDIDRFKRINDTFGHIRGDQLLVDLTHRINQLMSNNSSLYRVGGDEFVILFHNISKKQAVEEMAKIINNLEIIVEDKEVKDQYEVTMSVGLANYPKDVDDYKDLYAAADSKMYMSKDAGRDTLQY
ncbi:diguanylate cyclase (GGDEF) domain-containing protein [Aliicoccus persicus]|uniref:Diguanylate cyclase (GGDEF) domain-containing protein n=1 Tax=Aliicoccus persicus TaxID=930138 RepID=A0A662Z815_9STAP|nr:diguanylate cyclase (GGDEF) domain-containing protein [Aliicoccus persicus]